MEGWEVNSLLLVRLSVSAAYWVYIYQEVRFYGMFCVPGHGLPVAIEMREEKWLARGRK